MIIQEDSVDFAQLCNLRLDASLSSSLALASAPDSKQPAASSSPLPLESGSPVSEPVPFWWETTLVAEDTRVESDTEGEMKLVCSIGAKSVLRDMEIEEE